MPCGDVFVYASQARLAAFSLRHTVQIAGAGQKRADVALKGYLQLRNVETELDVICDSLIRIRSGAFREIPSRTATSDAHTRTRSTDRCTKSPG